MNANDCTLAMVPTDEQAKQAYRLAWHDARKHVANPDDRAEVVQDAVSRWATEYRPGETVRRGINRAMWRARSVNFPSCGHPDGDESQAWREDALRSNWAALGEHCRKLADLVEDPNSESLLDQILEGLRARNQWYGLEAVCLIASGLSIRETCKQTGYSYYHLRQLLDDVSTLI